MRKLSTYAMWASVLVAARAVILKLVPLGDSWRIKEDFGTEAIARMRAHYGLETNNIDPFVQRLVILIVTAGIATLVIWIFKRVRGELSFKASLPGGSTVEFSSAQTQITMWCIVFALVNLVR